MPPPAPTSADAQDAPTAKGYQPSLDARRFRMMLEQVNRNGRPKARPDLEAGALFRPPVQMPVTGDTRDQERTLFGNAPQAALGPSAVPLPTQSRDDRATPTSRPREAPRTGERDRAGFEEWATDLNSPLGGSRRMLHRLRQLQAQLARMGYGDLLGQLGMLREQANTDTFGPDERAATVAPYQEQLDANYDRAEGDMLRSLAARGIDTSSFAAAAQGGLAGQRAGASAELFTKLREAEKMRQLQAQQQFRALLMSLINGGTQNAAAIQNQLFQQQLAKAQMDAQNEFGLGDILNAGIQLYGLSQGMPPRGPSGGGGLGGGILGGWADPGSTRNV